MAASGFVPRPRLSSRRLLARTTVSHKLPTLRQLRIKHSNSKQSMFTTPAGALQQRDKTDIHQEMVQTSTHTYLLIIDIGLYRNFQGVRNMALVTHKSACTSTTKRSLAATQHAGSLSAQCASYPEKTGYTQHNNTLQQPTLLCAVTWMITPK